MSEQTEIMEEEGTYKIVRTTHKEGTYKIVRITYIELRCSECGKLICKVDKDEEPEPENAFITCLKCYDDSESKIRATKTEIEESLKSLIDDIM